MLQSVIKFSLLILEGNVWKSFGEFVVGYQGLKGLYVMLFAIFLKKQNLVLQQLKSKNNGSVLLFFETYI